MALLRAECPQSPALLQTTIVSSPGTSWRPIDARVRTRLGLPDVATTTVRVAGTPASLVKRPGSDSRRLEKLSSEGDTRRVAEGTVWVMLAATFGSEK